MTKKDDALPRAQQAAEEISNGCMTEWQFEKAAAIISRHMREERAELEDENARLKTDAEFSHMAVERAEKAEAELASVRREREEDNDNTRAAHWLLDNAGIPAVGAECNDLCETHLQHRLHVLISERDSLKQQLAEERWAKGIVQSVARDAVPWEQDGPLWKERAESAEARVTTLEEEWDVFRRESPFPEWTTLLSKYEEAIERVTTLEEALQKLANEAASFLSMADRETHGTTNMRVLELRDQRGVGYSLPHPCERRKLMGVRSNDRCRASCEYGRCIRRWGHAGMHSSPTPARQWDDSELPPNFGGGPQPDVEGLFSVLAWKKRAESAEARVRWYEEREASVCPEDVGFEELIKVLKQRVARLEESLLNLRHAIAKCEIRKFGVGLQAALLDAEAALSHTPEQEPKE